MTHAANISMVANITPSSLAKATSYISIPISTYGNVMDKLNLACEADITHAFNNYIHANITHYTNRCMQVNIMYVSNKCKQSNVIY